MAKPPDCSHCHKPATIHLTQINNNQIKKLDFCEGCPHQKGVTDPTGFSLTELLNQGSEPASHGAQCPSCGFQPRDFKKHARLGCPDCYESLADFIFPMLEKMHRGSEHIGKAPRDLLARIQRERRLRETQDALETAVAEEKYEEAARLRDELKALQSPEQSGNVSLG